MYLYEILEKKELQCQKVQQWVPEAVRAQSTRKQKIFRLLGGTILYQEVTVIMWLYKITEIHQDVLQMDGSYFI